MHLDELKQAVRAAGIAGCGGAGFPAYAKLDSRADTILLNCAECEPLFKVHRQVLERYAYEICAALDAVCRAVEAERFVIAVKGAYRETVEACEAVLPQFERGQLALLPEMYPAGDEVITIYEATGRVVPAGNLPIAVGVTVFNVETALNMYHALSGRPVTHKFVTVAGEVQNPRTLHVPLGMAFDELIELCGGVTCRDTRLLSGGPMTGRLAARQEVVTKTTNGILVLPQTHPVVLKRLTAVSVSVGRAKSACCQCRMCTDLCPRNLLGQPVQPHAFMRAVALGGPVQAAELVDTMYCVSCGVCELYACQQELSPRTLIDEFKARMRAEGVKPPRLEQAGAVKPQRTYRRIPMERLKARLGLSEYDAAAPLTDVELKPRRLKLPLLQHIGAPAKPEVAAGDRVKAGQRLADVDPQALSLPLFAPLDGRVADVTDAFILIEVD